MDDSQLETELNGAHWFDAAKILSIMCIPKTQLVFWSGINKGGTAVLASYPVCTYMCMCLYG